MDSINNTFISSTCWTERTGTSAALATIKKHIKCNVGEHLMAIGKLVQQGWLDIANSTNVPITVGGIYPLSHFEFKVQGAEHLVLKAYYVQEMLKKGFLASNIFYAMYAHTVEHITKYLAASLVVFENISTILAKNEQIKMYLEGEPAVAGFKRMT
jgi:glutamate-1-semialdehyde 2,1-aminomutase